MDIEGQMITGLVLIFTAYDVVKIGGLVICDIFLEFKRIIRRIALPPDPSPVPKPSAKIAAIVARGIPGSPGMAYGRLALDLPKAVELENLGDPVIFMVGGNLFDDRIGGIIAKAIFTVNEGYYSIAAQKAQQRGIPCVCKVEVKPDLANRCLVTGTYIISEGDYIWINGTTGVISLNGPCE